MKTEHTTHWVACHPSSMHNVTWKTLLLNRLLDWEAYAANLIGGTQVCNCVMCSDIQSQTLAMNVVGQGY